MLACLLFSKAEMCGFGAAAWRFSASAKNTERLQNRTTANDFPVAWLDREDTGTDLKGQPAVKETFIFSSYVQVTLIIN